MNERALLKALTTELAHVPAVVLLGPRQVGKTTLALELVENTRSICLDLQSLVARAKLSSPELYLCEHSDKLVILDEIHRAPSLFPVLRGLIDRQRRAGQKPASMPAASCCWARPRFS